MNDFIAKVQEIINDVFGPPLKAVFHPIDNALADIYMPWARICAVGLFVLAMVWVFSLRKEYVNLDRPNDAWYTDLRIWTVVAMLPHVLIYLFL